MPPVVPLTAKSIDIRKADISRARAITLVRGRDANLKALPSPPDKEVNPVTLISESELPAAPAPGTIHDTSSDEYTRSLGNI